MTMTNTAGGRVNGAKFLQGRDVAEIAKLVRVDIRTAVAAGSLPAGKYNVTISRYSQGRSVDVRFAVTSPEFRAFNPARLRCEAARPHDTASMFPEGARDRWTPAMSGIITTLEGILAAYNYSMPDRRNENFSASVHPEHMWMTNRRDAEMAAVIATPAQDTPADADDLGIAPTLRAPSAVIQEPHVAFLAHLGVEG